MNQNRLFSFVFVMLLAVRIGTNTMIFSLVAEQSQDSRDAITDTTRGTARLITTQIVSPNDGNPAAWRQNS